MVHLKRTSKSWGEVKKNWKLVEESRLSRIHLFNTFIRTDIIFPAASKKKKKKKKKTRKKKNVFSGTKTKQKTKHKQVFLSNLIELQMFL